MLPDEPYQLPPEFHEQPLTAGVLGDYALCPRRFLLSFFVSRDEERRFRGGPAALHEAVREALVDCYNLGGPHATEAAVLRDSFLAHWQGELCADSVEEQQLHDQGLQMLQEYHAEQRLRPVEVLATARRMEASLEGQAYVAVADVVLRPPGGAVQVVRFVTARQPLDAEKLAEDLGARLLWLLARETGAGGLARGEPPQVLFHALRKRAAQEVVLPPEAVTRFRRELASHAARLHREHEFAPVKGKHCRRCRVRNRCPAWQR